MNSSVLRKTSTAFSYLSRPLTYPFLLRLIKIKVLGGTTSLEKSSDKATAWCRKQAVTTAEGIYQLTGLRIEAQESVRDRFESIFRSADAKVAACPQAMGGGGNLDLLFFLATHWQADYVLETGVAYGWSSLALLLALKKTPSAKLISTNLHYSEYEDDSYVGCVVPAELRERWVLLKKADKVAIPEALEMMPEVNLCHYDSDKTYAGRLWAYSLLWRSLSVGGCFISDDIGDNLAFAHFCKRVNQSPTVVKMPATEGEKYIGILVKKSSRQPKEIMF